MAYKSNSDVKKKGIFFSLFPSFFLSLSVFNYAPYLEEKKKLKQQLKTK